MANSTATIHLEGSGTERKAYIEYPMKSGKVKRADATRALSPELRALPDDQLSGATVEYELNENTQLPHLVWRQGSPKPSIPKPGSSAAPPGRRATSQPGGRGATGARPLAPPQDRPAAPIAQAPPPFEGLDMFHNPYNFVPAPPRQVADSDLGDHAPSGHHVYHADRWSGSIRVKMHTVTPLLVPDLPEENAVPGAADGHKTYDTRRFNQQPYLPPTGIKGVLRSAFEAVTNSRLGVFGAHGRRLGYRMEARDGLQLIPARIENGQTRLLMGKTVGFPTWNHGAGFWQLPNGNQMYAAWLRYYGGPPPGRPVMPAGAPQHGQEVVCWVELFQHYRWHKGSQSHRPDFRYWLVRTLIPVGGPSGRPSQPTATQSQKPVPGRSWHEPVAGTSLYECTGYVCITNRNIGKKHDERVFFHDSTAAPPAGPFPLTPDQRLAWMAVIQDYRGQHTEEEIWKRPDPGGGTAKPEKYLHHEPGQTGWSPHIYQDGRPRRDNGAPQRDAAELQEGDLCYARVEDVGGAWQVRQLFPVIIARELYEAAPRDLLSPSSLLPASSLDELSPADRVFGWVNGDGSGAYRGNLRVEHVVCPADATEAINPPLPLAILGQPKPQQGRFYAAANPQGDPYGPETQKQRTYLRGNGLRGRKVYPHHRGLPADYWSGRIDAIGQQIEGRSREYARRPPTDGPQYDKQNRSVRSWVKSGVDFTFDIQVTNLSDVELGALLWLSSLGPDHHFRLGTGKPLGFGSVTLAIDSINLANGKAIQAEYLSMGNDSEALGQRIGAVDDVAAQGAISVYRKAIERAYGNGGRTPFEQVPFILAFLNAARGWGRPIHYPRVKFEPDPAGENFKWFSANDRGPQLALPTLAGPEARALLPIPPEEE